MAKVEEGMKIGYLTILCKVGYKVYNKRSKQLIYRCLCDCGNEIIVPVSNLYSAINRNYKPSCGCNTDQIRQINKKECLCTSKSGIKGVFFFKGKWYATIHYNGKTKNVLAKSQEDAILKRKELEEKYFNPIKENFNIKTKNQIVDIKTCHKVMNEEDYKTQLSFYKEILNEK